jgi:hypothetical protein
MRAVAINKSRQRDASSNRDRFKPVPVKNNSIL